MVSDDTSAPGWNFAVSPAQALAFLSCSLAPAVSAKKRPELPPSHALQVVVFWSSRTMRSCAIRLRMPDMRC
jgi:hypothetical protein